MDQSQQSPFQVLAQWESLVAPRSSPLNASHRLCLLKRTNAPNGSSLVMDPRRSPVRHSGARYLSHPSTYSTGWYLVLSTVPSFRTKYFEISTAAAPARTEWHRLNPPRTTVDRRSVHRKTEAETNWTDADANRAFAAPGGVLSAASWTVLVPLVEALDAAN
ncbi:hypothetical protein G7046_g6682 [Stylonectria norvegica]|nr:hypothetical protein G7046_g6682 [Stylonectria norvegica]